MSRCLFGSRLRDRSSIFQSSDTIATTPSSNPTVGVPMRLDIMVAECCQAAAAYRAMNDTYNWMAVAVDFAANTQPS